MQETMKQNEQILPLQSSSVTTGGTAIQLGVSHLIASVAALGLSIGLPYLHIAQPYALLIALMIASLCGFLCTFNLQYNLSLLGLSLSRLSYDQPHFETVKEPERTSVVRYWPLAAFFLRVQEIELRMQQYTTHALLTADLREKALQQARESAALAERNRIARELHDSIKQQIFSMSISAAAAKAHWQDENAQDACEAVEDIQRSAKEVQVEMQALFQQLRPAPLENTSLIEALQMQAQALGFRTGAQMYVELGTLPEQERLLPGTPEAIFRIVQEAFANIAKHARAQTIWLSLHTREQSLHIEVRDDGQGFDTTLTHKSMGLNNLHERAQELHGQIKINSHSGQGTTILISIPLLEALRSPEEELRQRYELARAAELSKRGYQLCSNASIVGLAITLINIITLYKTILNTLWSVVIVGILWVAIYGYTSGSYYRTRVVLSAGRESRPALELTQYQYRSSLELLYLLGLGAFYALDVTKNLYTILGQCLIFSIIICVAGIIQFSRRRYYRDLERYYDLFQSQELNWEIKGRKQKLVRALTIWSVAIGIILISTRSLFVLPMHVIAQQNIYDIVILALVIGIINFSEYFYIRRIQQRLSKQEHKILVQTRENEYV